MHNLVPDGKTLYDFTRNKHEIVKWSRATVLERLRELQTMGFTSVEEDTSGPRKKKVYKATLKGLIAYIGETQIELEKTARLIREIRKFDIDDPLLNYIFDNYPQLMINFLYELYRCDYRFQDPKYYVTKQDIKSYIINLIFNDVVSKHIPSYEDWVIMHPFHKSEKESKAVYEKWLFDLDKYKKDLLDIIFKNEADFKPIVNSAKVRALAELQTINNLFKNNNLHRF